MLKLKSKGKVVAFVGRKQFHGDEAVRAVTVRLQLEGVKLDVAKAFVSQIELLFDKDGDPAMIEVAPIGLLRDIANVHAEIGDVVLNGVDVSDVTITPMRGRLCSIDLKVGGQAEDVLDTLHRYLGERVKVQLVERQVELAKLEGGVAPEPQ